MAKRKLNRRQAARIKQSQKRRLKDVQDIEATESSELDRKKGLVIANYGATLDVEAEDGVIYRCQLRQNLEDLVCGDKVIWHETSDVTGVIEALIPRRSLLSRPDFQQRMKPIAANIDQIMITAAIQPELSTRLIDRYLVAAEHTGIKPVIVINKIDLLDPAQLNALKLELQLYLDIGYEVIYTSVKQLHGMDELINHLKDQISIFVGHSGVGKSSLIKSLLPDLDIRIGEISEATGKGTHTTTMTSLYHLLHGGDLIDSPGIREFGLWDISCEQLAAGFIEFRQYIPECKFRNCMHTDEPGCTVKQAVENGNISQKRMESYLRILDSLKES